MTLTILCSVLLTLALTQEGKKGAASIEEARSALLAVEASHGPEHPETATALDHLATLLLQQGDFAGARPLLERALTIREKVLGPEHPETAECLSHMGKLLMDQGDFQGARPLLERALTIREKVLGPEHPSAIQSRSALAEILRKQGDLEGARRLAEKTVESNEKILGTDHPSTARSLTGLALLLADLGEAREAFDLIRRSVQAREQHRKRILWSLTQSERLLFAKAQQADIRTLLSLPALLLDTPEAEQAAYETVLRWKGTVSRSLLRRNEVSKLGPTEQQRIEEIRAIQAEISREVFKVEIPDPVAHRQKLTQLRERRSRLERDLSRSIGHRVETPVTIADLVKWVPADGALLDFLVHPNYVPGKKDNAARPIERQGSWTPPRVTAWILRAGETKVERLDLGDAREIEEALASFREAVIDSGDRTAIRRANATLRSALWDPLQRSLEGADTILVSPDHFLGRLPFGTIQLEDGSYLLERHAFVVLADMATLGGIQKQEPRDSGTGNLLCVGGVDYDRPSAEAPAKSPPATHRSASPWNHPRAPFAPLPGTLEEARTIIELHEKAFGKDHPRTFLDGSEATVERVLKELPRHRIVHLATHGFYEPEGLPSMWDQVKDAHGDPVMVMREEERRLTGLLPGLLSGLIFAGANRVATLATDDGLLTAEEISLLDLSGVDLVVLAGGETGLGRAESGEGMLGLRRTLRQCGASTVISSLWKVEDRATRDLMRMFYEQLWIGGQGKLEALRGAQLEILKQNRVEYDGAALPSTWGAFVLDGDWR